jgi:hypothetical protein
VQSSWWGGLATDYSKGDARAIVARAHHFESWDQFAAFAEAMKDARSRVAQFERGFPITSRIRQDTAMHDALGIKL